MYIYRNIYIYIWFSNVSPPPPGLMGYLRRRGGACRYWSDTTGEGGLPLSGWGLGFRMVLSYESNACYSLGFKVLGFRFSKRQALCIVSCRCAQNVTCKCCIWQVHDHTITGGACRYWGHTITGGGGGLLWETIQCPGMGGLQALDHYIYVYIYIHCFDEC